PHAERARTASSRPVARRARPPTIFPVIGDEPRSPRGGFGVVRTYSCRSSSPRDGPAPRRLQPRTGSRGPAAPGAGQACKRACRDFRAVPGKAGRRVRTAAGRSWLCLSDVIDQAFAEPVIPSVDRSDGGEALEGRPFQGLLNETGGYAIEFGHEQISLFGGPRQHEFLSSAQLLGRDRPRGLRGTLIRHLFQSWTFAQVGVRYLGCDRDHLATSCPPAQHVQRPIPKGPAHIGVDLRIPRSPHLPAPPARDRPPSR